MCVEHRVRPLAGWRAAAALGVLAILVGAARAADEHIFEPGTKHVCVPAASGEGWDCSSADNPPDAATPPREPKLRSSRQIAAEAAAPAAAEPVAATPPPAPAAPAAAPVRAQAAASAAPDTLSEPRSRKVPNYLLAPEARRPTADAPPASAPPSRDAPPPAAAATSAVAAADTDSRPASTPAPPRSTPSEPLPATPTRADTETAPAVATTAADDPGLATTAPATANPTPASIDPPTPAASPPLAASPPPAASPPVAAPPPPAASSPPAVSSPAAAAPAFTGSDAELLDADDFRRLAATRYVVELAGGSRRDQVETVAASVRPADGRVWLLPMRRDGQPWYLAVWGDFDSVDTARAQRSAALAAGAANLGWPRRAGPLQQELLPGR